MRGCEVRRLTDNTVLLRLARTHLPERRQPASRKSRFSGTPWDITNVNGGAVALGHPYGMSGIRYLGQTLLELARRGAHRAIVGVCAAGGLATAAYLERT